MFLKTMEYFVGEKLKGTSKIMLKVSIHLFTMIYIVSL